MWRFRLYLSQLFLSRWLVATLGMLLLVGLLDSLANAREIAETGDPGGVWKYIRLRAPIIFDQIFAITLMLSLLLTFVSLIRRNELVSLQGIGFSIPAQVRGLAPIVILVGALAAYVIDETVPRSVRALEAWGVGEYEGGNVSEDEPLWLNDEGRFVRITGREGFDGLNNVMFFDRDDAGHVKAVTWAQSARYDRSNRSWRLEGVQTARVQGAGAAEEDLAVWQTKQRPDMIARLAAEPRNLSIQDLHRFAQIKGSGSRPSGAYRVWHLSRLTLPFTALALLLIAAPVMQRTGRRDTGTGALVVGLGLGFVFLIVDGIAKTMGSAGAMSAWLAGLGPSIGLALIGLYLWVRQEAI